MGTEDDQIYPVFNVEETIGKTVGNRKPSRGLRVREGAKAATAAWRRALPTGGVPKGVYKFKSHEEANEWMIKMLARSAVKKS